MRARGYALGLVLGALAALAAVSAVVWLRLDTDQLASRADERRTQLLWLARSAATHGQSALREVDLAGERAQVKAKIARSKTATRVEAEASLPRWGTARVTAQTLRDGKTVLWEERYERAP